MVISKDETVAKIIAADKSKIDELCQVIDEELVSKFDPSLVSGLWVPMAGNVPRRILLEVQKLYTAVGWTVRFESDQREGTQHLSFK